MKTVTTTKLCLIILLLISSCSRNVDQEVDLDQEVVGEKAIVAHPQSEFNDQIDGSGWEVGSTVTLEIDDPTNGTGADYTDSQEAHISDVENITISFFLGPDWDLQPGQIITFSDGETSVIHVVQDLGIDQIDLDADLIHGTAKPGSEVMVWIEFPDSYELLATADASGNWYADFTGAVDIREITFGAVAQNDIPKTSDSHTRVDWAAGQ